MNIEHLRDRFAHSAWAMENVLEGLHEAPAAFLARESRPGAPSNLDQLRHLAATEAAYAGVLEGRPGEPDPPPTLTEIALYLRSIIERIARVLESLRDEDLAAMRDVPWWGRAFTTGDCMEQMLVHTGQHRAELAWELAREGIDTGEVDFVIWRDEHGG